MWEFQHCYKAAGKFLVHSTLVNNNNINVNNNLYIFRMPDDLCVPVIYFC
jgi:hypothetical protein